MTIDFSLPRQASLILSLYYSTEADVRLTGQNRLCYLSLFGFAELFVLNSWNFYQGKAISAAHAGLSKQANHACLGKRRQWLWLNR